jgi:hypothetical protein
VSNPNFEIVKNELSWTIDEIDTLFAKLPCENRRAVAAVLKRELPHWVMVNLHERDNAVTIKVYKATLTFRGTYNEWDS